jgi:hypothetical protein
MLFSYYFDPKKTHRLICGFNVTSITEQKNGGVDIAFDASVSEIHNNIVVKHEVISRTFNFPKAVEGEGKHDIDFTRVRHGATKKWIFTVTNNKNTAQRAVVGLLSDTANKNPMGMDVYHDSKELEVELKANNLSILEQAYVPPVLKQTLASTKFSQAGFPIGFDSRNAAYDSIYLNYKVSEFTQSFNQPIPAGAKFTMEMDIAPIETTPLNSFSIFDMEIPKLGRFSLLKSGMEYMIQDGLASDVSRTFFDAQVTPADFWNKGMTNKARLKIEGDGAGKLTITYYGKTIYGIYDHLKTFSTINFRGALARTEGAV